MNSHELTTNNKAGPTSAKNNEKEKITNNK